MLAGSNRLSNADNDGEAQKPQPIDASAGHRNIENNVAVPIEVCQSQAWSARFAQSATFLVASFTRCSSRLS